MTSQRAATARAMSRALLTAVRDGALAFAFGATVSARVGHPAIAYARDEDDGARIDGPTPACRSRVVWCDVSAPRRDAIERGDVVVLSAPGPAPRARTAQRVVSMGGFYAEDAERGRCALRASRRWRARGDDGDDEDGDKNASRNDVGTVPIGVIHGRLSAVLWPPHAIGFVARED